jgi:2-polyprenyl-6-methoxyphenol hydroxylase-like FAD-dependent oxidoreductase
MIPVEVLVVGAGPAGLLAANVLTSSGVRFRIIQRDPAPTRESRATVVHGRSLELLDKLGLAESAVRDGQRVQYATLVRDQRVLANFPIGGAEDDPSPFPFAVIHEQWRTEQLLAKRLASLSQPIDWATELTEIRQARDGNTVVVRHHDGSEETILARYVVAADGARSRIREQLGIGFEGSTYEQVAFTSDVEMITSTPRDAINLLYFREGFVGFVPLKSETDTAFRLIGTLPNKLEAEIKSGRRTELTRADLEAVFEQQLKTSAELVDVHDLNIYRLHCRLARTFASNGVFLVGDAAHIHSPAGGQGMNVGMGDAFNLAWKLAAVLTGSAKPVLLDSYEPERRPVAQRVLNGSDRGFALEANKNWLMQFFNGHLLPSVIRIANRVPLARRFNSRLFSQNWVNYAGSLAVAAPTRERGLQPGARLPYVTFASGPHAGRTTHDLIRSLNHQLFVNGGGEGGRRSIDRVLELFRVQVDVVDVDSGCVDVRRSLGVAAPTMFLVRPDGHVCFRGHLDDLATLEAYLGRLYKRQEAGSLHEIGEEADAA